MTPAEALRQRGLLLLHDKCLASISLLVAGEPVGGSWWSHASGPQIFRESERIDDDPDVISVKLVKGKVTFIHSALWPALLRVAGAGDRWQRDGLAADAGKLLSRVDEAQAELGSDAHDVPKKAVAELEKRLLIRAHQIHTASGKHAKVIESWGRFQAREGIGALPEKKDAYAALERAADSLDPDGHAVALPWR